MTGAVVRELAARLDRAGWPLHHEARELIQQQAAEIERLTERAITSLRRADAHRARAEASEARTAALLKALERYGVHQWPCSKEPASVPCTCGLAAAKGAV